MSCRNNNENMLEGFQEDVRTILSDLDADGLLIDSVYDVYLVYETEYGGNPAAGISGNTIVDKKLMVPSPRVELNTRIFNADGILIKEGSAKVSRIVASEKKGGSYNRSQLEGASYWLIDGEEYDIVAGGLKRQTNGFFWEAVLQRRKIGNRIK